MMSLRSVTDQMCQFGSPKQFWKGGTSREDFLHVLHPIVKIDLEIVGSLTR
jgi:hypothetical protein